MRALTFALLLIAACEKEIELPDAIRGRGTSLVIDSDAPTGRTGWWPEVVFSADDVPHIAYCDAERGDLVYATRAGNQWQRMIVEERGAVGKYVSLAVNSKGEPGIAFYDQTQKYLRYAWRTGDSWQSERIAWGLEIGHGSVLNYDDQDRAHLYYYVPSGRLVHNTRIEAGQWQAATLAPAVGGFSARMSLVDREDGYWLSFVNWGFTDTALMLAEAVGDREVKLHTIAEDDGPGWRSFIAFEGRAEPTLLFSESRKERIKIARPTPEGWDNQLLVRRAGNFSGAPLPAGGWVIAYEDIFWGNAGNGIVKYLRYQDGAYTKVEVDNESPAGEYIDVATNSKGELLIAYYSEPIKGLKVYDETAAGKSAKAPPPRSREQQVNDDANVEAQVGGQNQKDSQ